MKKRRGLARAVPPLSVEQLEAMPTGALLARLKRLQWCEETPDQSDMSAEEIASVAGLILFKSDDAWREAHGAVKAALSSREHVGNKP